MASPHIFQTERRNKKTISWLLIPRPRLLDPPTDPMKRAAASNSRRSSRIEIRPGHLARIEYSISFLLLCLPTMLCRGSEDCKKSPHPQRSSVENAFLERGPTHPQHRIPRKQSPTKRSSGFLHMSQSTLRAQKSLRADRAALMRSPFATLTRSQSSNRRRNHRVLRPLWFCNMKPPKMALFEVRVRRRDESARQPRFRIKEKLSKRRISKKLKKFCPHLKTTKSIGLPKKKTCPPFLGRPLFLATESHFGTKNCCYVSFQSEHFIVASFYFHLPCIKATSPFSMSRFPK